MEGEEDSHASLTELDWLWRVVRSVFLAEAFQFTAQDDRPDLRPTRTAIQARNQGWLNASLRVVRATGLSLRPQARRSERSDWSLRHTESGSWSAAWLTGPTCMRSLQTGPDPSMIGFRFPRTALIFMLRDEARAGQGAGAGDRVLPDVREGKGSGHVPILKLDNIHIYRVISRIDCRSYFMDRDTS
ncbi:hypothetical protein WAI453_002003 [Rhynchosporium graminicola]